MRTLYSEIIQYLFTIYTYYIAVRRGGLALRADGWLARCRARQPTDQALVAERAACHRHRRGRRSCVPPLAAAAPRSSLSVQRDADSVMEGQAVRVCA